MTLKVRKRRPDQRASAMKSIDHTSLARVGTAKGSLIRSGNRFLPRRGKFSRNSQYTRHSTVFPQGWRCPWKLSYSLSKPCRGFGDVRVDSIDDGSVVLL